MLVEYLSNHVPVMSPPAHPVCKWNGLSAFPDNSAAWTRAKSVLESTDWESIRARASASRSQSCQFAEPITFGGRHVVRIHRFDDETHWIVRLRMPEGESNADHMNALLLRDLTRLLQLTSFLRASDPKTARCNRVSTPEGSLGPGNGQELTTPFPGSVRY